MTVLVPKHAIVRNSRLAREIAEGRLLLKGDSLVRYNFVLYAGEALVPIYGIRSTAPHSLVAVRAWNRNGKARDPATGREVSTAGRRFDRLAPSTVLFLIEFDQNWTLSTDRVAFKASTVKVSDTTLTKSDGQPVAANLRYEEVELRDVVLLA